MLEDTTTNLVIAGDITGMAVVCVIGYFLIFVATAATFGVVAFWLWQTVRVAKSNAWYCITRDAYKVGLVKKHAEENNITLCYEPDKKKKGLMQELDDDVKRDIGINGGK